MYQSAPYNNTTYTSQHHTTILHVPVSTIQPYYMYHSLTQHHTTILHVQVSTIQPYYMYHSLTHSAPYNHTTCTSQHHTTILHVPLTHSAPYNNTTCTSQHHTTILHVPVSSTELLVNKTNNKNLNKNKNFGDRTFGTYCQCLELNLPSTSHPVHVCIQRKLKLLSMDWPYLHVCKV